MKVALDTNVLAYAVGVDDALRQDRANAVIDVIDAADIVVSSQVAGELYNVLVRKTGRSQEAAAAVVRDWIEILRFTVHGPDTFAAALNLASEHNLQIWDALILCSAQQAGCRLLLSEDMQDGFVYRGVTVANPFAERLHPLLASILDTVSGPSE